MPMVNIKVIEGVFSDQQRRQIIEKVTDAMTAVGGEPLRDKTVVILEQVKSGDWAIGGHCITTQDVEELQKNQPA